MIRANGGEPFDDRAALFDKPQATVGDETAPANLRWLDGNPSGFTVTLASKPGRAIDVDVSFGVEISLEKILERLNA